MRVLVTGGAGFIGSHLAEALCRRGASVVALDNLRLGSLKNLAWKKTGDALEFVAGDVTDAKLVQELVKGCDWVFHEAAVPSVPYSVENPMETNAQNLDATLQLLTSARDARVKRFLFASSSAIYGDSAAPAKRETDIPKPQSPYALQKFASERYGQMFHSLYGMETISFRYFNVFGPRQSYDSPYSGVIAKFCTTLIEGGTPIIFGDGIQSRDFTVISDVVQANLVAAEAPASKVAGKVFNIAGGQSVTLLDLLTEIGRLLGMTPTPEFRPARAGDVRNSLADITEANKAFGYSPSKSWQEGLKETLEFYQGERRNE